MAGETLWLKKKEKKLESIPKEPIERKKEYIPMCK
jgi:hypothetical protein